MRPLTLNEKITVKGVLANYGIHGKPLITLDTHAAIYYGNLVRPLQPLSKLYGKLIKPLHVQDP